MVEDLSSGQINLHAAKDAIESAKSTVQFAPMLCILFVATRMRALQMTQNRGAPQGWVQDGMYLASWSGQFKPEQKVWIGSIAESTTWKELEEHMNQAGKTKWAEVFKNKGKGTGSCLTSISVPLLTRLTIFSTS